MQSKDSTIDDLQNNVDTLEGGVQVLHQEIAQQGEQLIKTKQDADHKLRYEEVHVITLYIYFFALFLFLNVVT